MSKIISYDFGHLEGGQDTSANGYVYEYAEIRKYAPVCISYLEQAGYTCVNCTPLDNQKNTLQDSLSYRTNHANASGSILHICFHVDAFQTTNNPMGAEIEIAPKASDTNLKVATSVLTEICKLGFINRGVKRPSLWVTENTNMPCVLVEPFFCDSKADVNLYNPQTLGKAIAQGVLNVLGGNIVTPIPTPTPSPIPTPTPSNPIIANYQKQLNSIMNAKLTVDGISGSLTVQAIKNFQLYLGLTVDGIMGSSTQSALNEILSFPILNANNSYHYATRYIQHRLGISADGIYGNGTMQSVKNYQKNCGLGADGIVGQQTWKQLWK